MDQVAGWVGARARRDIARALACALLLGGATAQAAECRLAAAGQAAVPIVLGQQPCAASRHMAETLSAMLGKITGATFAVTTGDGSTGVAIGLAGEFPALAQEPALALGERFAPTDLATRQGYVLRSHAAGVQIVGASDLGVLYGGWDFLYRLGYRRFFPHPAWEVIPERPELALAVDDFERPDFLLRRIAGSVTPDWDERNRTSIDAGWKIPLKPYLAEHWQQPLIQNQHNWGAIVEHSKEEFAVHPEYLGLVRVKIDPRVTAPGEAPQPGGAAQGEAQLQLAEPAAAGADQERSELRRASSKLCVANPGVREAAVRYARDYFARHPEAPSISMEPTDGGGWCECDGCARIGPPAERVMLLANTVAEALEQGLPDRYVGILAYHLHAEPPTRPAHPRVCVSLATALSGSLPVEARLAGWSRVCGNLGIYEYLSVMEWHLGMPAKSRAAHLAFLSEKIPAYHRLNVRFFTGQATGGAWGAHGLGFYVLSRLLWDVDEAARVPAIVDDFLARAFGAAAEPMREYYRVIDASQAKPGTGTFFLERASRMYAALRAARQATPDPAVHRRLNQLVLYTRYVELFGHEVEARRTKQHYPALARLVRFAYRLRDEEIVDGYGMIKAYVNGAAAVPLRPAPVATPDSAVLDEPAPPVHEVDRPFTESDIEAILDGTSVIPVPDTAWPELPPGAALPEP